MYKNHTKKIFLSVVVVIFASSAFSQNRVEQLFLWKLSDELNLTVSEEKKLTQIVQTMNQKKENPLPESEA